MNTPSNDDKYVAHSVLLRKGKKLVESDDERERKPMFFMMSYQSASRMQELGCSASWLFWTLMRKRDVVTNIALLSKGSLSVAEYSRVRAGLIELEQLNLCKRIKQNTYMFNPDYVIPKTGYSQVRRSYEGETQDKHCV